MRLFGVCLSALAIAIAQAKAIDQDETRIWIKRQFAPTNGTDAENCVKETVTETLRETVTISAAGGVEEKSGATITVTVAASGPSAPVSSTEEEVNAKKFEGLRLSFITETETQTIMATAAAETITIQESASTVTQMLTIVEAPPASTVTQIVTEVVSQSAITLTETLTIAGQAPVPVTITETVRESCQASPTSLVQDTPEALSSSTSVVAMPNGIGVGVSTVPIPESALPTTTFDFDPLATSSQVVSQATPPPSLSTVTGPPAVGSGVAKEPTLSNPSTSTLVTSNVNDAPSAVQSSSANTDGAISTTVTDLAPTAASTTGSGTSEAVGTTLIGESSAATSSLSATASDPESTAITASEPTLVESSAIETTTEAATSVPSETETILTESTAPSPAVPTSAVSSLNLGLSPDTTAQIESAVSQDPKETAIPVSGGALILPQINISTLTFSSALELGNLMGVAVTPTPTVAVQAQMTEPVSSMMLKVAG